MLRAAVAMRVQRLSATHASKIGADARIVGGGPIVLGILRAIDWLSGSLPWPQASFSTEAEAIAWARVELAKRSRSYDAHVH